MMRTGVVRTYVHINTYMRTNECVIFLLFFVVCFVPRPDSRFWEGWLCYVRVVFCFFVYGTYENGEQLRMCAAALRGNVRIAACSYSEPHAVYIISF